MKDGKIRIGLIGAGNICQNSHIPAPQAGRRGAGGGLRPEGRSAPKR